MRMLMFTFCFALFFHLTTLANDSLRIAQAFINLSLTNNYFDTLSTSRIIKIASFLEKDLSKITDSSLLREKAGLYNTCYSLLYLTKAKLLYRTKINPNREELLKWKKVLDTASYYYYKATSTDDEHGTFYEFINFSSKDINHLGYELWQLKDVFAKHFNQNIYPDFKRLLLRYKNEGEIHLDSLNYYAKLFDIRLRFPFITQNDIATQLAGGEYTVARALDLISKYLQLNYIVETNDTLRARRIYEYYEAFVSELNPDNDTAFGQVVDSGIPLGNDYIPKDAFFRTELNRQVCTDLLQRIRIKFPHQPILDDTDGQGFSGEVLPGIAQIKYYFPDPAPFPSCIKAVPHFRSEFHTIRLTNRYLRSVLRRGGYEDRYQYYYYKRGGFAITTQLERIFSNGKINYNKRWDLTVAEGREFNLYDIFKTIFFAGKVEFRMVALVVSPSQAATTSINATYLNLTELIRKSYPSLPLDLEDLEMVEKTLTVMIYHFNQNDAGEVPQLDVTKRLSVSDHLSSISLRELLND
ncbi:MAG TPA: hypothetical protein VGN63_16775 [Flavisolibacter sp.]|jgi:hypothetical protein|nr:hypothetical protein [Flavisolibacter sp.]